MRQLWEKVNELRRKAGKRIVDILEAEL